MSTEAKAAAPKAPAGATASAPPGESPDQKRVREWDWSKEPHDWTTVPTNFTPEAYNPAEKPKPTEEDPFPANSTAEVRALPVLKALRRREALKAEPKSGPQAPKAA